jgi:hypothetical protein
MTESNDAWEDLSLGTLSKEEEALLRALAEESEHDAARLEAHAPLGAAFEERTVDKLAAQLEAQRDVKAKAEQQRFLARRSTTYMASGLAVAAAALLLFWPREDAVPPYTLNVLGSVAEVRGDTDHKGPLRLLPESPIEITLTPEVEVSEPLALTVGLVSGERVYIARGQAERAPSGAFRLAGTMAQLFDAPPGRYQLVTAVAHGPLDGDELRERLAEASSSVDTRELLYEAAAPLTP